MKGEVRRYSKLPREEMDKIDYKNIALLQRFVTERGKIRSRRVTGLSRRDQSKMARAVKRSRELGLLPYVDASEGPRAHRPAVVAAAATASRPSNENHSQYGRTGVRPVAAASVVLVPRLGRLRRGTSRRADERQARWWRRPPSSADFARQVAGERAGGRARSSGPTPTRTTTSRGPSDARALGERRRGLALGRRRRRVARRA